MRSGNQLGRRNLSDDQRAMMADEAAEFESKLVRSEQAKKARAGQKSDVEATASTTSKLRVRAKAAKVSERKLGQLIPEQFPKGGDKKWHPKSQPATLVDSGISRTQSSRWRRRKGRTWHATRIKRSYLTLLRSPPLPNLA